MIAHFSISKMDPCFVTSPEDLRGKAFRSSDRHLYKRSRIQTWQMLSESDRRGIFPTNSLFFVGWVEVTKPNTTWCCWVVEGFRYRECQPTIADNTIGSVLILLL